MQDKCSDNYGSLLCLSAMNCPTLCIINYFCYLFILVWMGIYLKIAISKPHKTHQTRNP
jgi:hypothetical protein